MATATGGASLAATAAIKAGVGLAGGLAHLASNHLLSTPQHQEIRETMSFNEFRHKYLFSKTKPISLLIEYNQELANQYLNKRELKGPMLYSYRNFGQLGALFVKQTAHSSFYLKASVVS